MRIFNAFQMVLLFAAAPFILTWAKDANFYANNFVFWTGCVLYVAAFSGMTGCLYTVLEEK